MNAMLKNLAAKKSLRVAGLMSGTSADGVDVAVVDLVGHRVTTRAFAMFPYPRALRQAVLELCHPTTARIDDLCWLNFALGEFFADCLLGLCRRSRIAVSSLHLIGSHGQTVWHDPVGRRWGGRTVRSTLQIAEPSVIAERTGITTVADFRPRDIAAGGQGAPLVPYADLVLFGHPRRSRALQNIGGIANVTFLPAGPCEANVLAFDTGPGNMIMDRVAWRVTRGRAHYDKNGKLAAAGCTSPALLRCLMRNAYLRRRPPKTTGREMFGREFSDGVYDSARRAGVKPLDILATVTNFTAATIADAYRRYLPALPDEVIVCGGGSRNPTLLEMLRRELAGPKVRVMDELGIDADAKEAVSFALLAAATVRGLASNVPSATGARRPAVLGKIIPGNSERTRS